MTNPMGTPMGMLSTGVGAGLNYWMLRRQGMGRLAAAGKTFYDFAIAASWPMQAISAGNFLVNAGFKRINANMNQVGRAGQLFGTGTFKDNAGSQDSRAELYQHALGAGRSTQMSGRSWAGNEARILHQRYG